MEVGEERKSCRMADEGDPDRDKFDGVPLAGVFHSPPIAAEFWLQVVSNC